MAKYRLQFSIDLNPAHLTLWRGHRSPCVTYLWDAELRPGNAGTWDASIEVLDTCFAAVPPDIRELRVRADAGFGFIPVFVDLEDLSAQYAVVARLTQAFKRLMTGFEL